METTHRKLETPRALDRITDVVLAHRIAPKTKAAKRRERRREYAAKKGR